MIVGTGADLTSATSTATPSPTLATLLKSQFPGPGLAVAPFGQIPDPTVN